MALARELYITNSHRIPGKVAESVTEIHPGQLFQFNDNGEFEYADGTKKAYPTLNSRYSGEGLGLQGERLEGRDDVSRSGLITVLRGNFEIGTDQYDKSKTYTYGAALKAGSDGLITLFDAETDYSLLLGHVTYVPEDDEDMIRYEG